MKDLSPRKGKFFLVSFKSFEDVWTEPMTIHDLADLENVVCTALGLELFRSSFKEARCVGIFYMSSGCVVPCMEDISDYFGCFEPFESEVLSHEKTKDFFEKGES